jgi:hypothetical protein
MHSGKEIETFVSQANELIQLGFSVFDRLIVRRGYFCEDRTVPNTVRISSHCLSQQAGCLITALAKPTDFSLPERYCGFRDYSDSPMVL